MTITNQLKVLSLDCLSGDQTVMELELYPTDAPTPLRRDGRLVEGRINILDGLRGNVVMATIELDHDRIERLRAFLRGET